MSRSEPTGRTRARPNLRELFDSLQAPAAARAKTLANSLGMAFVLVPAGSFRMGSPAGEPGHRTNEAPVHEVVLTADFYLATTPVTQAAFQRVTGRNPAAFAADRGGGPDHPVEMVSWDDAADFCRRLGELPEERAAGRTYRLPTEAEWEYACRSGVDTPFAHGADFTPAHGWFDARYPYGGEAAATAAAPTGPPPVGTKPPTAFGLSDMHGTVWEWCADWYAERYYAAAPLRDPSGPESGTLRVLRGGSWKNQGHTCRAAYRNALAPHQKNPATGFRVVLGGS